MSAETSTNTENVQPMAGVNITDKDFRHLAGAFLAHRDPDNIDIDVFTKLTGHPNTSNARKRLGEIKKKMREEHFGTATPAFATGVKARPAATPRKRASVAGNLPDDEYVNSPPTKRSRNTKKAVPAKLPSAETKAGDEADDEADDDEV